MEIEKHLQHQFSPLQIQDIQIANGSLIRLTDEVRFSQKPELTALAVAEAKGATAVEMTIQMPDGSNFNLLGNSDAFSIESRYQRQVAAHEAFAGNVFFQPGAAGALVGVANGLMGHQIRPGVIAASVCGCQVTAPLNHGLGPGQRPHHLHGFAFDKPTKISRYQDHEGLHLRADFEDGFHLPYWVGKAKLHLIHSLNAGTYTFEMQIQNVGDVPMPMGAGSHPYFCAPSEDPGAVRLWIPGKKLVEIGDEKNVLPTGRILPIEPDSDFDFHKAGGRHLNGRAIDHLWVDLELDQDGFAFTEFIDDKAKFRIRMTALTKNIIGIQAYAPKPVQGVFAALELVTNLPDPREDLWNTTLTGMRLLAPGDSMSYGYKLETRPWGEA